MWPDSGLPPMTNRATLASLTAKRRRNLSMPRARQSPFQPCSSLSRYVWTTSSTPICSRCAFGSILSASARDASESNPWPELRKRAAGFCRNRSLLPSSGGHAESSLISSHQIYAGSAPSSRIGQCRPFVPESSGDMRPTTAQVPRSLSGWLWSPGRFEAAQCD